jgi:hypothetical protein
MKTDHFSEPKISKESRPNRSPSPPPPKHDPRSPANPNTLPRHANTHTPHTAKPTQHGMSTQASNARRIEPPLSRNSETTHKTHTQLQSRKSTDSLRKSQVRTNHLTLPTTEPYRCDPKRSGIPWPGPGGERALRVRPEGCTSQPREV